MYVSAYSEEILDLREVGGIYVVKVDHFYKIGKTNNIESRIKGETFMPPHAELFGYWPEWDSIQRTIKEAEVHQYFERVRFHHREWFNLHGREGALRNKINTEGGYVLELPIFVNDTPWSEEGYHTLFPITS